MIWKILTVVLLLLCFALIIIIWNPGDITGREKGRANNEYWFPFDFSSQGRQVVRAHITDIKRELGKMSGPLTDETIDEIYNFFRERGQILTHNGDPIKKQAIYDYLKEEQANINNIKFTLEAFTAFENTHNRDLPDTEENRTKIEHYVELVFKINYKYGDKDIDPAGRRDDYHIRDCHWINP